MRKILCITLICIMCNIGIVSFAANTQELQQREEKIKEQINEATENLQDVDKELSTNLQQVQKLDETIANSENELNDLNTKIEGLQTSINSTQERLSDVEDRYNKQKNLLDNRLVSLYEAGDIQYIDVVLSSANIADFISNYFLVTELASYDTGLLEVVEKEKKEIETSKEKLDKEKEDMITAKQTQLKTAKVLENTRTLREQYIAKLSTEEQDLQKKIDEYNAQYAALENEIRTIALNSISPEYIGGVMAWPVPGYTKITSEFKMRVHPITGVYKLHTGVDIGAPTGTNFIAAADGVVTKAGFNSAYGNMVIIDHGGGISTLYAHGSEIMVEVGQNVKQRDTVLKVGSTGYATGPHAHFEVRVNGSPVQPLDYITSQTKPSEVVNGDGSN